MRKLWFDRDVMKASALHATCETEMQHLRAFGYKGPIALIGNPVDVPNYSSELANRHTFNPDSILRLGYLGRLHPIKQIENLIRGTVLSRIPNLEILIIGKGDDAYEQFLHDEAKRLGISGKVKFLGFLNGREKFEQLARLDALFVPSHIYKYTGIKSRNGKQGFEVILTPENKQDITSITLFVSQTYQPLYIKVEQSNKSANEIIVTSYQTNQPLDNATFKFDKKKFPNAEVIDLR